MLTSVFFSLNSTLMQFLFILYLSFLITDSIHCQSEGTESDEIQDILNSIYACTNYIPTINEKECLNNIFLFEQKEYQLNSFTKNKAEDILIQYSEKIDYGETTSSRLFFGLTKDGDELFSNKTSHFNEFNIDIDEETIYENEFYYLKAIQDSKSIFVSLKNDRNKGNQYLFSINSYYSMVELYDFNNDKNNHLVWNFDKFFKLDSDDYYFPFQYELFELKDTSEYIIAFIPQINVYEEILDLTFIKKFRLLSFDFNAYEERAFVKYQDYLNIKIINVFLIDDLKTIGVLLINETINEQNEIQPENPFNLRALSNNQGNNIYEYKYNLKFYNLNLKSISYIKDVELNNLLSEDYKCDFDIFIKSLYMNILGDPYILFVYYHRYSFFFDLFDMNYIKFKNRENKLKLEENWYFFEYEYDIDFDIDRSPNDLIKISDYQVVFMYSGKTYSEYPELLSILILNVLLDLYPRVYYVNLNNYFPTSIKGFSFNGYLLFSATGNIDNNYYNSQNYANYISMFMIFGYANGTDSVVDISKFIFKENNDDEDNNFFMLLFKKLKIENNIFGYFPFGIIKLVSIPPEISIFQYNILTGDEIPLEEPFISNDCIFDDEHYSQDYCEKNDYIIKQDNEMI